MLPGTCPAPARSWESAVLLTLGGPDSPRLWGRTRVDQVPRGAAFPPRRTTGWRSKGTENTQTGFLNPCTLTISHKSQNVIPNQILLKISFGQQRKEENGPAVLKYWCKTNCSCRKLQLESFLWRLIYLNERNCQACFAQRLELSEIICCLDMIAREGNTEE